MRILFGVLPSVKFQSGKTNCCDLPFFSFLSLKNNDYSVD